MALSKIEKLSRLVNRISKGHHTMSTLLKARVRQPSYAGSICLFLLLGVAIGAATYVTFLTQTVRAGLKFGMVFLTLFGWLATSRVRWLQPYRAILQGFFAVSLGVLLTHYLGNVPLQLSGFSVEMIEGVAVAKLGEALPIVLSILAIHFAFGDDMDGLYLKRGNLRLWLIVGLSGFAVFAGLGVLQVIGSYLRWSDVWAALPWILIFLFSNAFMEELWFRALFLKKLEPLLGRTTSLAITSIVFAIVHISSIYVIDILLFMVALLALGWLWGYLMQKTNSIWGSVLIHAGADLLVIMGFLMATAG